MQIFTELFASLHTSSALVLDHWEEDGGRGKSHLTLFRSGKKTFESKRSSTKFWSITALCWLFKAWRTLCRFILGGRLACRILRCTCLPKAKSVLRDVYWEKKGFEKKPKKQANHPQNIFCVPRDTFFKFLCILLLNYFWRLFLFNFHQKSVKGIFCHSVGSLMCLQAHGNDFWYSCSFLWVFVIVSRLDFYSLLGGGEVRN